MVQPPHSFLWGQLARQLEEDGSGVAGQLTFVHALALLRKGSDHRIKHRDHVRQGGDPTNDHNEFKQRKAEVAEFGRRRVSAQKNI